MKGSVFVGTSGWNYKHWANGRFYPQGLAQKHWLSFYAERFGTVEINNTFYRLPSPETLPAGPKLCRRDSFSPLKRVTSSLTSRGSKIHTRACNSFCPGCRDSATNEDPYCFSFRRKCKRIATASMACAARWRGGKVSGW